MCKRQEAVQGMQGKAIKPVGPGDTWESEEISGALTGEISLSSSQHSCQSPQNRN